MTNYSNNPKNVRVDFFKPSGKWYDTVQIQWTGYGNKDIHKAFRNSLIDSGYSERFQGMTVVCLEPYHQFAHPLMIVNWG